MKHLGDITKLKGSEVPLVDIVTGGSPCQDLSVAGKREGLAGERSGLFMEQIRLIKEMRESDRANGRTDEYIRPRYMVWENVPGAFSSNKGEDFRCVLEETAKVADSNAIIPRLATGKDGKQKWSKSGCIMGDGWSIAWRLHDAQFWGVPQRRKRIALVADFGGETAPEILFERKGVSGDTTESGKEGESAAANAETSVTETGGAVSFKERAGCAGGGKGILIQNERTGALSTLNNQSVVYGISAYDSNSMKSGNPNSGIYEAETARTLDLNGGSPACNQGGMAVVQGADVYNGDLTGDVAATLTEACGGTNTSGAKVVCIEGNGSRPSHKGDGYTESDTMYTLNSTEHHAVAYRKKGHPQNAEQGQGWEQTEINDTLNAFDNGESRTPTVVLENHPADSRVKISKDGIVQTLSSRMGTGGGNVPMVMESPITASKASYFMKQHNDEKAETLVVTDYKDPQLVAYGLDRASFNQGQNAKYDFQIDEEKIGCQVAKGPGAVCTEGEQNETTTRNQILRLLQETYGEKTILKWGTAILERLQQTDILQQGMYESGIQGETENRQELDDSTLPCPSVVAEWLLRDMRKQQECGCSPQGWESSEQRIKQSNESVSELSQQNPQTCKEMFDMWEKGEGLGLLREALSEIQKIWKSVNGQRQSVYRCSIVRRLTPLEAERLQGFPDHWTDIGDWVDSKGKKHKGESDSPRYKALGNSIALPFWQYLADKMCAYLKEPTMASLFDGIGGFPLVFSRCGCTPVWASEIEEFPIAVTKIRFKEEVEE